MLLYIFTEPRNVSIETLNMTTALACWYRPSYGKARKFEIKYSSKDNSFEKRVMIHHKPRRRQCMRLESLVPGTNYDVEIRALNGHQHPGMPVKMAFKMPTKSEVTGLTIFIFARPPARPLSFTHSLARSLARSLTHSLTHSPTH